MRTVIIVAVLILAGLGCGHVSAAQARFARDYDCPIEETTYRFLGNDHYHVQGCEKQADYTCLTQGSVLSETTCVLEQGPTTP
jgi:hypothetical protein